MQRKLESTIDGELAKDNKVGVIAASFEKVDAVSACANSDWIGSMKV